MDSQLVTVEALCLHKPVELLDHKRVVNRSDQLNVTVMARAEVGCQSTCWTATIAIKWRHAHSLVMQTLSLWVIEVVESLCTFDLNH